ncbi:MAG: winged helix-turn-helix transcriptional regulator, partial [Pseudomonadota bacterium]
MDRQSDTYDRTILRELARDGRITNTALAERVGLSPSPCWQRRRRLEQEGYILGYTATLNQEKLGSPETV